MIVPAFQSELQRYLGGLIKKLKGRPYAINSTSDHVHLLVGLPPTISISDALRFIKANSSGWVHDKWSARRAIGETRYRAEFYLQQISNSLAI